MLRFFVFIIIIYLLYKIFYGVRRVKTESSENQQFESQRAYGPATGPQAGEDLVEDPVCHTYVPISQAYKKEISGRSYYFCSQACAEKYLSKNK